MSAPAPIAAPRTGTALGIGAAGIALTAVGVFVSGLEKAATSWLIALTFWIGIGIGMLLLVMIHHIFDAGWSTVIRRQYEHALAAFKWLALLFVPLLLLAWLQPGLIWGWMNLATPLHDGHGTVGTDVLYLKKSGFLNRDMFTGCTAAFFGIWIGLSYFFRRNSFSQDGDGDVKWTLSNRKFAAAGLPLTALSLTFAIIFWVKSLEYHWFSTMYGVWFFAGCMRAALSTGVIIMVWLWNRGDYRGILNNNHLHCIGQLMLSFTVFWAYVTFSQYFLIWNANVPEETFWYNLREMNNSDGQPNQWKWVGLTLLFGHFFLPFLLLLWYPLKLSKKWIPRVGAWIIFIFFLDLCYNIMPAFKDHHGDPEPFLQPGLLWTLAATAGIGGVCVWAYLRSFATTKLIPIRDPRIVESLTHHEANAP